MARDFLTVHFTIYVFVLVVSAVCYTIPSSRSSRQYCPIPRNLNESSNDTGSSDPILKVIDLSKIDGKKVRIQFYTPNPARALEETVEETTLAFPYFVDDTSGAIVPVVPLTLVPVITTPDSKTGSANTEQPSNTEVPVTTSGTPPKAPEEVGELLCQWEFQAANESEYLLLTFNNLSAPYSTDCSEAYVALQKDTGYESRWCGNRRQANSRPMSLFSKTKAKITVFRRGDSPTFPPTGFTVTVESLDIFAISGIENSLRVLLG
ncbi:unnamed protein product [Allacma fusca]|uniref:CUB domain-containing protein n=1 Tax=Allacma fusca TaxID=39272 RepID=A0A8J2JP28_9HEXA|nr:unnamed protein product [Allacma fusca]